MSSLGTCSICKLCLVKNIFTTHCGHIFHGDCIKKWIDNCDNKICPICRSDCDETKVIKLFPESNKNEVSTSNALIDEDELEVMTLEMFRCQNVLFNQFKLFLEKIKQQEECIERTKIEKDKQSDMLFKEILSWKVLNDGLKANNESIQTVVKEIMCDNESLKTEHQTQIQTISTMKEQLAILVSEQSTLNSENNDLKAMLSTANAATEENTRVIDSISTTVHEMSEDEEEEEEDVGICVMRLVDERNELVEVKAEQREKLDKLEKYILEVEVKTCELEGDIKDLKMSRDVTVIELNKASHTITTHAKEIGHLKEELSRATEENECYQADIENFIAKLNHKNKEYDNLKAQLKVEETSKENFQTCLTESLESITELKTEIQQIMRTMRMKEDVIDSLQNCIESNNRRFSERLSITQLDQSILPESDGQSFSMLKDLRGDIGQMNEAIMKLMDAEISRLGVENERKSDIAIHLMKEKEELKTTCNNHLEELQSRDRKISTLDERVVKHEEEEIKLRKQINDNEVVIAQLVSVVNQYAYCTPKPEHSSRSPRSSSYRM